MGCKYRDLSVSYTHLDVYKRQPHLVPVNLNDLVFSCKRFMEGMCADRNITITLDIDEELGEVKLDVALFEQVLVNIIKNAAESIEPNGEIKMCIRDR